MDDELFDSEVSEYFNPDPEYENLDRDEIIKKLEDGSYLEEIRNSETWRVFREAWRRIYKQAELQLDNIDPTNPYRISEAQITKRFYKDVLATTIKKIREDAKIAFEHAKERKGILDKLIPSLKKDL